MKMFRSWIEGDRSVAWGRRICFPQQRCLSSREIRLGENSVEEKKRSGASPPASSLLFYFLLSLYLLLSLAPPQKVLGLLLAHSADVNARDKLWQTPLHVAAANRATKCAEALAPLLSSLNVADRSGRSALHHAVHSGHLEVRTMLVGAVSPSPPTHSFRVSGLGAGNSSSR